MKHAIGKEFKEFALRGNVLDLAIGVIIGGAMNKIISSLVSDILIPFTGVLSGGVNFKELKITLTGLMGGQVSINYGIFLQNIIEFIIIAWSVFIAVKLINKLNRKKQPSSPSSPTSATKEELILIEIRDLLKKK